MESIEETGLESKILEPAERALRIMEFVQDMKAFQNAPEAPVELAPKARELLIDKKILAGGQAYRVIDIGPDFGVKAEPLFGGLPSGQEVVIPWVTLRGFDLAK